jgi:hypothetical protein
MSKVTLKEMLTKCHIHSKSWITEECQDSSLIENEIDFDKINKKVYIIENSQFIRLIQNYGICSDLILVGKNGIDYNNLKIQSIFSTSYKYESNEYDGYLGCMSECGFTLITEVNFKLLIKQLAKKQWE